MAQTDNLGERIRIALGVSIAVFAVSLSYWGIFASQQSEADVASTTTINFDAGTGQIAGDAYPDLRITSSGDPTAFQYGANNPNCPGYSHPSPPYALYNAHPGGNSPLVLAFTNGRVSDQVSLTVAHFSTAGTITIQALDTSGAVVDTKTVQPQANSCLNSPVSLTPGSSSGIAQVRIAGTPESTGFWGIDDFRYAALHDPITNFSFSATPATGPAPLAVTATYTGQGSPTSLNWDFGDGQRLDNAAATVQHTYQAAGTYTITLTSGSLSATKTVTVTTATPLLPTLSFATSKSVYAPGEEVSFTLTNQGPGPVTLANSAPYSISNQAGSVVVSPLAAQVTSTLAAGANQRWQWNQQLTAGGQAASGTYTVTVTYSDAAGQHTKAATFTIAAAATTSPTFTYTFTPTAGSAPLTVQAAVTGAGSETLSPLWDFGDGATATGRTASHTYTTPGTYTATVRIGTQVGSQQITVAQAASTVPASTAPTTRLVRTGPSLSVTLLIAFLVSALLSYFIIRRPFHS